MKKAFKTLLLVAAVMYGLETNTNCAAGVVAAAFIPLIGAAQWYAVNEATKQHVFFFNVATNNSNTSSFAGTETIPGVAVDPSFKGSFTNHDIQFTYDASSSKKGTYTGSVNDSSTVITLTGDNSSLPPLSLRKK